MEKEEPLKNIAKGAIIFLIGTLFVKLLTYIFRIIIARTGVENYGVISLSLAVYGVISVICIFGMDTGLYGLLSLNKDEEKTKRFIVSAAKISLILSIILSFLLFILSDYIATALFHNSSLGIILKIIAIAIPFGVFRSIIQSALRAFKLIKLDTITRVAENFTRVIIVSILLYLGLSVIGIALAYTLSIFISFLIALIFLEKKIISLWKQRKASSAKQELIKYSWPLLLNNISILIFNWTDTLMLGFFKNSREVGLYNTATPTANLLSVVNKGIMTIFLPITAEVYLKENKEELSKILKTATRWIFMINSFGLIIILSFSKEILGTFFGSEYTPAYLALLILAIFYMASSLADVPREVLLMIKKTKTIWHITLVGITANIILNYLLIPKYSYTGASIATGISLLVTTIAFFIIAYKETKIVALSLEHIKISLIILISVASIYFIKQNFTLNIILVAIIGLAIHGLLLIISKSIKKEEKEIIKLSLWKLKSYIK